MTALRRGVRVLAQGEPGTVMYVRMAPPAYADVAAVSVKLDARAGDPKYCGSMFAAADVAVVHRLVMSSEPAPAAASCLCAGWTFIAGGLTPEEIGERYAQHIRAALGKE